jgi:DNA transformation protein
VNAVNRLCELQNIGPVVAQRLEEAGIETPEALKAIGSREAFLRLRIKDSGACLSMLCGLEGAIRGLRWHHLPDDVKADLKAFHKSLSD